MTRLKRYNTVGIALFYLKKTIGMILMPIPLTLLAMCLALLLMKKCPKFSKLLLFCGILLLGLTSWNPVADRLIATVEHGYHIFDTKQAVDVIVVLGSGHQNLPNTPAVMQLGRSAIYRLEEGIRILNANPTAQLFVSGFGGHAQKMRDAAIELGVKAQRIKMFPKPKDTEEEANSMKPYLEGKNAALVTEASHLKRASIFFEQAGIKIIPAPAMYLGSEKSDWQIDATAAYKSQRAFYEWLGRTWQWIKG